MSDTISRRQFLLGRVRRARPSGTDRVDTPQRVVHYPQGRADLPSGSRALRRNRRRGMPLFRPPGAVEEHAFLDRCTRCGDCLSACPPKILLPAPERFGDAAGTPVFDPATAPCRMCTDLPCIAACGEGALSALLPRRMGMARIDTQVCLAHQGTFCSTCREQCPVPGAIHVEAGRPRIDEDACTGCGVCSFVCPAPHNAIVVMPALTRPMPAATDCLP